MRNDRSTAYTTKKNPPRRGLRCLFRCRRQRFQVAKPLVVPSAQLTGAPLSLKNVPLNSPIQAQRSAHG
jgi:hypothetical protein